MNAEWRLLNVDQHRLDNPDFFAYPTIILAQRETVQVDEQVKILASLGWNDGWKTTAVWVVVESVLNSVCFVGRPFAGYKLEFPSGHDRLIEFGPEHIYRMPPREFTIWGRNGQPVGVWGNGRPHGSDGDPILNLEPISTVAAMGWVAMQSKYAKMSLENDWPPYEDLPNFED